MHKIFFSLFLVQHLNIYKQNEIKQVVPRGLFFRTVAFISESWELYVE